MVAIPKIIRVISCGFLLCLGLSSNAVSAVDGMKAGYAGERIGGQSGRGYEQVSQEHRTVVPHAGERIGGQSGRGYEQVNQEHRAVVPHAGERIGGQSGRGYEQPNQEHKAVHPHAERIGGQAYLSDMERMGK